MINAARLAAIVVVLSGLDVAGAIALKEAQVRSSPGLALFGVATFVSVAAVLYLALNEAELTVVSLAWIILYQVTVMGVDIFYYKNMPTKVALVAIVVALIALSVAAVAGTSDKEPAPAPRAAMPVPTPRRAEVDLEQVPLNLRLMGLPTMRSSPEDHRAGSTPGTPATPRPAPPE